MAGKGGFRPGAGRKPKRLHPATLNPIRLAELKLAENLPALMEVALSLALEDRDKAMVVYCIDRVLGRTVQRQETGEAGAFDQLSEQDAIRVLNAARKAG